MGFAVAPLLQWLQNSGVTLVARLAQDSTDLATPPPGFLPPQAVGINTPGQAVDMVSGPSRHFAGPRHYSASLAHWSQNCLGQLGPSCLRPNELCRLWTAASHRAKRKRFPVGNVRWCALRGNRGTSGREPRPGIQLGTTPSAANSRSAKRQRLPLSTETSSRKYLSDQICEKSFVWKVSPICLTWGWKF